MSEEWRYIPGYPNYQVSDAGRVANIKWHDARLLTGKNVGGYRAVSLYRNGHRAPFYIHRLVMLAFRGECPSGAEVNHINGDKSDNGLSNLEYTSHQQNTLHRSAVLGKNRGDNCHRSILTEAFVRQIRRLHGSGVTIAVLANRYGVGWATVYAVVHNKSWKHVVDESESA